MKVDPKVYETMAGMNRDQFVRRMLCLLAFQIGGDERKAEVKEQLRRGRDYWQIAFDLGANPELIYELGGPKI
jgi:hypothetical protein